MGDEDKPKAAILGSAGMAAAGMMPGARSEKKPAESHEESTEAAESADEAPDADAGADDADAAAAEEPAFNGFRVVVIGHTGEGGFGRDLDRAFHRLDGVRLSAISDGDGDSVEDTRVAAGAPEGYARYREMLEAEKPDLVCIAPRWTHRREDMLRDALEAGAHVICEGPFTRTLKEADELTALAEEKGLRISSVDSLRCSPHLRRLHEERDSLIGDLMQIRIHGDQGAGTAGGEDLLLRGIALFDVARWFAGEASYATATITKNGVPAIGEDVHESEDGDYGPLLGDSIHAEFVMDSGVQVSFDSDARLADLTGPAGIEFIGTKGRMRLILGEPPELSLLRESSPGSANQAEIWERWPEVDGDYHAEFDHCEGSAAETRRTVRDWIDAIGDDREPEASAENAMKALEIAHGIWQAGVTMKRAYFPLVNRLHPLSEESR
jgi:predicted dehydrogenase